LVPVRAEQPNKISDEPDYKSACNQTLASCMCLACPMGVWFWNADQALAIREPIRPQAFAAGFYGETREVRIRASPTEFGSGLPSVKIKKNGPKPDSNRNSIPLRSSSHLVSVRRRPAFLQDAHPLAKRPPARFRQAHVLPSSWPVAALPSGSHRR